MGDERNELDELSREIRRVIENNRKFLDHVMDEEFEPEDAEETKDEDVFEEL
ncbi:hypothetical protein KI811_07415 [Geobacter hydrogenophilus]|uniref:Uncharacterized protein n=1 Tax=Geobacter hydrogenophilus TaxID=40983 RepID=A0A9W6FZI4_9BACT|nr:hypothetical protein [Geobacter hydrogenophilus]MBT0893636.1 hypothetical protein [Geobacter hydrogenophilus]GLI37667.1 hypothetical protein GHYDROH2_11680 [Geobacter hydrogenophilus]